MYGFNYNFIKKHSDAELIFKDTDSLTYEWIWRIFLNKKILRHKIRRIQSKKHKLETYEIDKKRLSCYDDERSISNNGIHTLAYFHKDLRK